MALTRLQKRALWATIVAPVVAATVGLLIYMKGGPSHSIQQSSGTSAQGDVHASTGGFAVGPGATINVNPPAASPQPSKATAEPSLYVECHITGIPTKVSSGRFYVLMLQPIPAPYGGGLAEYFTTGEQGEFKWGEPPNGFRPFPVQHCEITNDGSGTLFNIEMAIPIQFMETVGDKDQPNVKRSGSVTLSRPWMINVARIDPGRERAFGFYIWNQSKEFAQTFLPEVASGQVVGENARRPIRVIHPVMGPTFFNPIPEEKQTASAPTSADK
jgi:hypothetical protein